MCGITGWADWQCDLSGQSPALQNMVKTLAPRGPDAEGLWLSANCALGHRRLSVIDPRNGAQPMVRTLGEHVYALVYNGELYNALELRGELEQRGHRFRTNCDTEVVLLAYIEWGKGCLDRLAGIYAFAIWSEHERSLFLARDRTGVKPLFYTLKQGKFYFGSEPKAILAHPDIRAEVDAEGLAEIFAISPARTPGQGIYKQMHELKPGHFAVYNLNGFKTAPYWRLESLPHPDDLEETARKVRDLLKTTVESQLVSDVPIGTLLSGGLDSSAITAFAVQYVADRNKAHAPDALPLPTFSVDYSGNDKHFKANAFQPDADSPWIQRMVQFLQTDHHFVEFSPADLADALQAAVHARDFPGMADVDSSLYLFCREIRRDLTVAVSGEGADEIFGGYPWFHRTDSLNADTFPWSLSVGNRADLLSPELINHIKPEQYVADRYRQALDEVPHLAGENAKQKRMREMSYLNITRFMPTLLDRKDRMSMACGLEVRVPFCDHRLIEYVWNIPWEIKMAGDREKGILRHALRDVLPEDVLYRKKSPYPKTHDPHYLSIVKSQLLAILHDPASPLLPFVDVPKLEKLAAADASQFNLPWFGQLMSGPQLFAYFIQVDYWLRDYGVAIV